MAVSCDRIVRGLRDLGIVVDVVHFTRHFANVRVETKRNGQYIAFPPGDDAAHALNMLFERLEADPRHRSYTHVVAFGGHLPLLAGPTYAAWWDIPLVTLFRGNDFDTAIFSPHRKALLREALERSAKICVVSRDKERRIAALHPNADVLWTPNGIDLDDWTPLPSDRKAAQDWRSTEVEKGRRVLGLFGQIKPKKGGLVLLESLAASGLSDRFHLLLVGDMDEEIHARLSQEDSSIRHTAHPFGDRYALLRQYCACDAVAIPSFYDGMPNVLLEAMGLGLPILGSTAGGMGDILEDGVHGFLFHPGDPHGCRRAITRLAEASEDTLRAMGQACLETARKFDPTSEARAYESVLRSTMRASGTTETLNSAPRDDLLEIISNGAPATSSTHAPGNPSRQILSTTPLENSR